jgi:hypothetical protein
MLVRMIKVSNSAVPTPQRGHPPCDHNPVEHYRSSKQATSYPIIAFRNYTYVAEATDTGGSVLCG